MPSFLRASCLLLPFMIIPSMLVVSSEGCLSLVFATLPNKTDSNICFCKFGFLLGDVKRPASGGPDPQHH
ncbi:CLAVATA3/ESR (CLE)-related protein 6-like [Pyrus ussuriensis x Pyrus communis]|uniref:CLAVATA3/ESR (CLE)-related protein 6-like n=1 Tax=Pyrus ussuriensis x Pyrus communis TaxID=2448454 RepID=A0A5N5GKT4_9ROSA|nr:CLAVATA3/ESR (CLE)-related protein 6-like [Pyrus ussuriensis x Pyrus communis]